MDCSSSSYTFNGVPTLKILECFFANIITYVTGFVVLVVFLMFILGGFKYITAAEDPKAAESAKHTLTYAFFGMIALVGIWLILKFFQTFTGVNVTEFSVGP